MKAYVWDIEADGLLSDVTRVWVQVFKNIDTEESHVFIKNDDGWMDLMNEADLIIGHNIIAYDLTVLKKLHGFVLPKHVNVHDTMIMSQVIDYNRFPHNQHGLDNWGLYLGYPKVEHEDWTRFSQEMLHRCETDVELNSRVYERLLADLSKIAEKRPEILTYLRAEHYVSKWSAEASLQGWPFAVERAKELFHIMGQELQAATDAIEPMLGLKAVAVDKCKGEVEVKEPKWTKAGCYHAHTAAWFGLDPWSGFEGEARPIEGPYCRVTFEPLKLSSTDDMKTFLFRNGWVPTEWNFKKDPTTRKPVKTSPKITEDSIEFLEGTGKLYTEYCSTSSRYSILKTWLENVDEDGRLHGQCFTIGTPSMRATHKIIANIPTLDSKWGKEIRELFGCDPDWVFVGADSSGNQARGLAHYLESDEYTDLLLNGDVHTYNAQVATRVLAGMGIEHEVSRGIAKRLLYAFLFGASGAKLWSYIFGVFDAKKGNAFKKGFTRAVPGFESLVKKLDNVYGATKQWGDGYILGLGGNRIYVDSFHKLLVYLLQAAEKATCAAAVMLTMQWLEEEGIPYQPFIMYHDEIDFQVPAGYAEKAGQLAKKAFQEGPKLFGVEIMDGEFKLGKNWAECH